MRISRLEPEIKPMDIKDETPDLHVQCVQSHLPSALQDPPDPEIPHPRYLLFVIVNGALMSPCRVITPGAVLLF